MWRHGAQGRHAETHRQAMCDDAHVMPTPLWGQDDSKRGEQPNLAHIHTSTHPHSYTYARAHTHARTLTHTHTRAHVLLPCRVQLPGHELLCPRLPVGCEYCKDTSILRMEQQAHEQSCPSRPHPCVHGCGQLVSQKATQKHDKSCPNKLIDCPKSCGQKVPRMQVHVLQIDHHPFSSPSPFPHATHHTRHANYTLCVCIGADHQWGAHGGVSNGESALSKRLWGGAEALPTGGTSSPLRVGAVALSLWLRRTVPAQGAVCSQENLLYGP